MLTTLLCGHALATTLQVRPSILKTRFIEFRIDGNRIPVDNGRIVYLTKNMEIELKPGANNTTISFPDSSQITIEPNSEFIYLGDGTPPTESPDATETILLLNGSLLFSHASPEKPFRYKRKVKSKTRTLGTLGTSFRFKVTESFTSITNEISNVNGSVEVTFLQDMAIVDYLQTGSRIYKRTDPRPPSK